MPMIWDFTVDHASTRTATAEAPKVPTEETLPTAPLLDTKKLTTHCNCSLFPKPKAYFSVKMKRLEMKLRFVFINKRRKYKIKDLLWSQQLKDKGCSLSISNSAYTCI